MSHAGSGALLPFLAAQFPGTQWVPPAPARWQPRRSAQLPTPGVSSSAKSLPKGGCSQAGQSARRECMPHFYQNQKRKQTKYPPFLLARLLGLGQTLPRLHRMPRPHRVLRPGEKRKVSERDVLGFLAFFFFLLTSQHILDPLPVTG